MALRLRKRVLLRLTRFSCMRSLISSGFHLLLSLVDDLYGCYRSSSLLSCTLLRYLLLIGSQALSSVAQDFSHLLAYNIMASAGAGICETVAVMVVDESDPATNLKTFLTLVCSSFMNAEPS